MNGTATDMVENLLSMVDTFGYVPNGSRTYYTNRRQGGRTAWGHCMGHLHGAPAWAATGKA